MEREWAVDQLSIIGHEADSTRRLSEGPTVILMTSFRRKSPLNVVSFRQSDSAERPTDRPTDRHSPCYRRCLRNGMQSDR